MTNAESEITKKKEIVNCKAICKDLKTDAEVMEKEANSLYTALFVVCFLLPELVYFITVLIT